MLRRYSAELANCRFGGALPALEGMSEGACLHALLTINATALQDGINDLIPLLFPFRHVGGRVVYSYKNESKVEIIEIFPETASNNYPYADYPEAFDIKDYILDGPATLSVENFASLIPNGINKNLEGRMVVLIPSHEEYGVSLWGSEGTSDSNLCVFYVDTDSKEIRGETQAFESLSSLDP